MDVDATTLSLLQGAGFTTGELQTAVASLTGIDATAQNAVLNVAASGPTPSNIAALLSAGFAMVPGGAVVSAAIGMGLPLVQGLAQLLGGTPQYAWQIGAFGVHEGTKQPFGPKDPNWRSYDRFIVEAVFGLTVWDHFNSAGINLDVFVPGMLQMSNEWPFPDLVGNAKYLPSGFTLDKSKLPQKPTNPSPLDLFRMAYNAAWHGDVEFTINGHQWVDPYVLLQTIATAWNATHAPGSSVAVVSGSGPYYINHLVNGDYDGKDHPAISINTGKVIAPAAKAPAPVAAPAPAPVKTISLKLKAPPPQTIALHLAPVAAAAATAPAPAAAPAPASSTPIKIALGGALLAGAAIAARFLL